MDVIIILCLVQYTSNSLVDLLLHIKLSQILYFLQTLLKQQSEIHFKCVNIVFKHIYIA